jgi:ribosome biogenesis GTPase A
MNVNMRKKQESVQDFFSVRGKLRPLTLGSWTIARNERANWLTRLRRCRELQTWYSARSRQVHHQAKGVVLTLYPIQLKSVVRTLHPKQIKSDRMSNNKNPTLVHRKVAVLGFRAVGKSSLTNSFVTGSFSEAYDPTIEFTHQKVIRFRRVHFATDIVDTAGMVRKTVFS